jgi:hypothetical protein
MKITPPEQMTDDLTVDDLYEMQRIDSLPERSQQIALAHVIDQFESVPIYTDRFVPDGKENDRV